MLWIFRYLCGYLTVLFHGEFPEKILNLAAGNRIFLWNSRLTEKGIESCISVKDFRGILPIIRKSGVKIHILKRHGLVFKTAKNRKRSGIIAGFLIFLIFLEFMSGYVWIIDINGNKKIENDTIISALQNIGIKEGVKKTSINPKNQRERLLLEIDSLAWASLNLEGCRLTVNVSEIKEKKPQEKKPSNLKASADGIIKKIDITSGNCLVKSGDTVKKGDILVSGIIEKLSFTEFVHSQGTIIATTERSITAQGDFMQTVSYENGKSKVKRVLELFSLKIPLFLGSESQKYNSEIKNNSLFLFGQKLPVKIHKKNFYFLDEYTVNYSEEKLIKNLEKEIDEKLKAQGIDNYTVLNRELSPAKNGLSLTFIVSSEENIAVSEEMLISPQSE